MHFKGFYRLISAERQKSTLTMSNITRNTKIGVLQQIEEITKVFTELYLLKDKKVL